jgi:hypothetical protein
MPSDGRPAGWTPDPWAPGGEGDLRRAARATAILAYGVGLAGAGGATLSLRQGDLATALLVLTTTLAVAATLVGVGRLLTEVRALGARLAEIDRRLG